MNFIEMNAAVAGTLAQIIPVLFLALLFEIRVRHEIRSRSALGIVLGFFGNFIVAVAAVVLEFKLLYIVQIGGVTTGASFEWIAAISLFAVVVMRWVATTTLARIIAANGPTVKAVLAESFKQVNQVFEFQKLLIEILLAPSQVLAEVLTSAAETLRMIGASFVSVLTNLILIMRRKDK